MRHLLTALFFVLPLAAFAQKKQAEVKIQKTSLSRDQELRLGNEAASQVERQMEVVQNPEIESWLNQIGQQLSKTPQANAYPYYFKLVNEDSINAFALPGGPMYIHTGLIKAAANEGEVAGVLAHEMSHVALRHGAAQMSKQQTWGTLFGVIGAIAAVPASSADGSCSMLCQAAQAGVGLAGNSVLMKFSRGYEHDADLNGARMMASASYNPIELATFFEKLQAQAGGASEPKGLALWLSSHPADRSRTQYISDDIKFYPKRDYGDATGQFPRIKQLVASLPPPKPKPAALLAAKQGNPRTLPAGFKDYQAVGFAIGYPAAWQAGQPEAGSSLYLIPPGGATQSKSGGVELIQGAMIDYYVPQSKALNLDANNADFIATLQKGDTNLRAEKSTRLDVGGKPALMTRLNTKTTSASEPDQTAFLYTVERDAGLWYVVLATPPSKAADNEPVFREIVRTVKFPD